MAAERIEFFVAGDVTPWARTAGGKSGHRFTPGPQRNYMAVLKSLCHVAMRGSAPLEGPIKLELRAVYPWPKTFSSRKRADPASVWRTGRPDYDNVAKIVGDALNAIAWLDDAQIATAYVEKTYGYIPGLHVKIDPL